MIKQLKKTNDINEANRLLGSGWVLLAENIEFVLLGLPNNAKKKAHQKTRKKLRTSLLDSIN